MGITEQQYLDSFLRVNLLSGPRWDSERAAGRAASLLVRDEYAGLPFVLLGFAARMPPFTRQDDPHRVYLLLPHPSGRCRAWNEPGSVERARWLLDGSGLRLLSGWRASLKKEDV
jgi:hypothetical protein